MGVLQLEHLPRSSSHEITGTFSYQGSWWPHFGHFERGRTTLSSLGRRAMTTLRKLPTESPMAAIQMVMSASKPRRGYLNPEAGGRKEATVNEPTGNVLGLKPSELKHLKNTWRRHVSVHEIVSTELARHLTEFSRQTNRQVGVLFNRKGNVEAVVVGNAHQLELPDIGRARAGQVRLRGLRLVHTHLKSEPLTRDDLTDLALLRLDLVAAIGVKDDGLPGVLHYAHLLPENDDGAIWRTETLPDLYDETPDFIATVEALEDELASTSKARKVGDRERAVLVAVCLDGDREGAESSLAELRELARTAGVEVVDELLQVRRQADPKYLIGHGKLDELNLRGMQKQAEVLIFDKDLSPAQARHIGEATSMNVLDRTQLILDIFAQRARSGDGKLQVELAQLKYLLPRLVQSDSSLSRLSGGGGVGGRGPGETKLEIDRRRARDRITFLERKIDAALGRPKDPPPPTHPQGAAGHLHRRLHQRRQVDAAQRAHQVRGARRGQALRHARPHPPAPALPPRARGDHHRHRGLHSRPAQRPGRRLPRHPGGAGGRVVAVARGGRVRTRRATRTSPRWRRSSSRSASTGPRGCSCGTRSTGCRRSSSARWSRSGAGWRSAPSSGAGSMSCSSRPKTPCSLKVPMLTPRPSPR